MPSGHYLPKKLGSQTYFAPFSVRPKGATPSPLEINAKSQYLKTKKESLEADNVIIQGDFSKNFSFVIQCEKLGYHRNQVQCTLHPIVIYTRNDNDQLAKAHCLCFLSQGLSHDTGFVYTMQNTLINYIIEKFPQISNLEYFSNGCTDQYKNLKFF